MAIDVTGLIDGDGSAGCVTAPRGILRNVLADPGDAVRGAPAVRADFDHNGNA